MSRRTGLYGRKISSPPGFDPGLSNPQSVAIPTKLPGPHYVCIYIYIYIYTHTHTHSDMMALEFSFHFNDTVSTAQISNRIMFKINARKEDTLPVAQQCLDNWGISDFSQ